MPTYSYKRPVKVLLDDSSKYVNEHLSYFFNIHGREAFYKMSVEDQERLYEHFTDDENILVKLFGE